MASVILNKEERLQYIKESAQRIRDEKRRMKMIYETDTEMSEEFAPETDFSMIEEFCGMVSTGVAKIQGGLRKLPVIIL